MKGQSRYRGAIVLLLDAALIAGGNFLMFLPELVSGEITPLSLVLHIGLITVCVLAFQILLRTYDTLWRYAGSGDGEDTEGDE